MQEWKRLRLLLVTVGLVLSSCRVGAATVTKAPTDPLPATVPALPFANNPDPTLCGIPQPVVYLYNSHLMNAITGQVYPGTGVNIELSQNNPTLNFYFVKSRQSPGCRLSAVP